MELVLRPYLQAVAAEEEDGQGDNTQTPPPSPPKKTNKQKKQHKTDPGQHKYRNQCTAEEIKEI